VKDFTEVNRVGRKVTHSQAKSTGFGYKSHSNRFNRPKNMRPFLYPRTGSRPKPKQRQPLKKQGDRQKQPTETVSVTNQKSSKEVSLLLSENTAKVAGRLKLFSHEWEKITPDRYILDVLNHYKIECQPHNIHETILTEQEM